MPRLKKLPANLMTKTVMFGDGPKGYAVQIHENKEHGVTVTMTRENREANWEGQFVKEGFDGVFSSYKELREAWNGQVVQHKRNKG